MRGNNEELNKIIEKRARELLRGASNDVVELGEDDFDEFVRSRKVVVDFWAPWCAPCFLLEPIIKALAREMPVSVSVG